MQKQSSSFDPNMECRIEDQIGSKIREYRQARGLTQKTLGEMLGVSFQQIQKYEQGKNKVSAGRLIMIATALKIPVSFFFYEKEKSTLEEIVERDTWFESLHRIKNPALLYHILHVILQSGESGAGESVTGGSGASEKEASV